MPIYAYRCRDCGTEVDQLRRLSDATRPADCPKCGPEKADRALTAPAACHSSASGAASLGGGGGGGCGARGGFT